MTNTNTILVKIGGSTLGSEDTSFEDIARLQQKGRPPVVVHGGGPAITSWMAKLGIRAEFVNGLRVTDEPSLDVATAVLAGLINKQLVARLSAAGAKAVGVCGADGGLMDGAVTDPGLGFVAGRLTIDIGPIESLLAGGYVPVIAPIAIDTAHGHRLLNVNADTAAGAIAVALAASHLVFLTDVDGVMDTGGRLLGRVTTDMAEALMGSGIVKGGMVPKLLACVEAQRAGVLAHIVNGTRPSALIDCLGGKVTGTTVSLQ